MDTPSALNPAKPPSDWLAVRDLFEAALALPAEARPAFIAAASVPESVKTDVISLLAHHPDATGHNAFLSAPAALQILPNDAAEIAHTSREGQRYGAWQIVRAVGTGGMGDVFEARRADGSFEGRAAIKLLKRGMDSTAVLRRFAQERQALARLSHPHIARLLDAGASDDGLPYFVMEFVAGVPIDEAVRSLPLEARLSLFLQLADAVAHAHRNLLVHRDLKPGNVLVTAEGEVKLLDFGIAKALDPVEGNDGNTTVGGVRPYTPNYASPEQVRGEPVSTATDIYSLGVLLYQLLTGVRPTGRAATTPMEAARSVLEEQPTRPSSLSADLVADPQWMSTRKRLQGDLDNILLKALEKSVERRYASVDALAADVQNYLAHRPVNARPASVVYVLKKFVSRNRWAVLAATLGSVGLTTGLAAALLQGKAAAALGVVGLTGGLGLALVQGRQAAVSRDEARKQLAGVKNITSELVFRFGDAITLLPGGAAAQEAMLKQTIESLDVTLQVAPNDVDLIVLVSCALGRLAQIQGAPTFTNGARAAEATSTVTRALEMADRVWISRRGDWRFGCQHIITLLTQANMLRNQREPSKGLEVLAKAAQRSAEVLSQSLSDAGRAEVLELRANVLVNMAHFNDHVGRPSMSRPAEALKYYGQAETEFRALYGSPELMLAMSRAAEPGSPTSAEWANHNIGNVFAGRALVHQRLDDDEAMHADAQAAILMREDNLRLNPGNAIWRQSLMFDSNTLAIALLRLTQDAAALVASQRSWDIAAQRLQEEGPDSMWATTQAQFAPQFARALAANGRLAEAIPIFELGIGRLSDLLKADSNVVLRLKCAWLQVNLADALARLGEHEIAAQRVRSAKAELDALKDDAATQRNASLALAEAFAVMAKLNPSELRNLASQSLTELDKAAATRPLSLEHARLRATLSAAMA
jgi:eukaryotic-like serine/threonine-protein kinase